MFHRNDPWVGVALAVLGFVSVAGGKAAKMGRKRSLARWNGRTQKRGPAWKMARLLKDLEMDDHVARREELPGCTEDARQVVKLRGLRRQEEGES